MPKNNFITLLFASFSLLLLGQSIEIKNLELLFYLDSRPEFLKGEVRYNLKLNGNRTSIELKLDEALLIDSVLLNKQNAQFLRKGNTLLLNTTQGSKDLSLVIFYSGKPKPAVMPPWKGGWIIRKDEKGRQWITVACQGEGAQIWWPSFDDKCIKPEHTLITGIHSSSLKFVSNGKKVSETQLNSTTSKTTFELTHPVNSYNISFGLGHYAELLDTLIYPSGTRLPLHVYVLDYEVQKCKQYLLPQIHSMLKAYNVYLGEYPFLKDGFGIIQTPYAGMEHQSGIAYGNGFKNGYLGMDYSGIGLPFDFILIHETGHEWFGNLIATNKIKDFWINEGFCTYAEKLYVKAVHGDSIADKYMYQKQKMVKNEQAIATDLSKDNLDQYNKGALLIHTIEKVINDSAKWAGIIKNYITTFSGKCASTDEVFHFFGKYSTNDFNLAQICHQYLFYKSIPELEVKIERKNNRSTIYYRLISDKKISLPVELDINGNYQKVIAKPMWNALTINRIINDSDCSVNRKGAFMNFKYVRK